MFGVPRYEFDELKAWVGEVKRLTRRDVYNLEDRVRELEQAAKDNMKKQVLSVFDEFVSAHSEEPDVQQARNLIENATFNMPEKE